MWIWVFLVLALAAMASMIANIVLAVKRGPQQRGRYIRFAVISAVAMAGLAATGSVFARTVLSRPLQYDMFDDSMSAGSPLQTALTSG